MPKTKRLKLPSASKQNQLQSKDEWNNGRCPRAADFYTVGYSGRELSEVVRLLLEYNVRTLVDVRQHPVSMYRPEVSKRNLKNFVEQRGILYVHIPDLGVPRDIRAKSIKTGSRDVIWDWYDQYAIPEYLGQSLHRFLNSFEHPVALMCTEIDPRECHRHRLSLALENLGLSSFDL